MLTLIKTLFDIILMRVGPESIPRSPLMFAVVASIWLGASVVTSAIFSSPGEATFSSSMLLAAVALCIYSGVVISTGHRTRLLSTITAVLGCGAIIQAIFLVCLLTLEPMVGRGQALLPSYIILLWSVPVEGHILARAIAKDWYIGFLIALTVLILQIELSLVF